jgi:catechol 2,3-dioxygenase-like lactoylglutathione lyase family enzyme
VTVDLFAGVPVSDYDSALTWYARLLGSEPAFFPDPTEAVWELAEHDPDGNEIGFGGATVEPPGAF